MKTALFIDGSNLFGGLYELAGFPCSIKMKQLLDELAKDFQIDDIYFYATYMRSDNAASQSSRKIAQSQKAFFDSVKSCQNITAYWGHLSKASGKEKGVDVHMAVDIALAAAHHNYSEIVIITGDADLQYAVEVACSSGVTIHLAAISSRFPVGIAVRANRCVVYDLKNNFFLNIKPNYRIRRQVILRPIDSLFKNTKGPAHNAGHVLK